MNNIKKNQNKKELLIIAAMLVIAVLMIVILKNTGGGSRVVVTIGGEVYGTYDLKTDQTVEVHSEHGSNIFIIKNGSVDMISADCPDKICVNMSPISDNLPGVIVCLPNELIVEIQKE